MTRCLLTLMALFGFFLIGCTREKAGDNDTGKITRNGDSEKKAGAETSDPQKPDERTPDFTLTAKAITKEYVIDEKSANSKFENKVVAIMGEVCEVSYADVISLKGEKEKNQDVLPITVRCVISPQYVQKSCRLSYGQKVSVVGKVSKFKYYSLTLDSCTLIEMEPSSILITTGPEIAREFESDPKAAQAKYKENHNVIFSGVVEELTQISGGPSHAKLTGHGKLRFSVHLLDGEWEKLRKGQTVQVRCQTGFDLESGNDIRCGGMLAK